MRNVFWRAFCAVVLAVSAVLSVSAPAQAANPVSITGGTCTLIDAQANGVRLDFCTNLTGKTVNDIHVIFSFPGLPNEAIDYGQSIGCTLFGLGNCFGHAVAPGSNWDGISGGTGDVANPLVWGVGALSNITDFNVDHVTATGYWTIDGVAVAVPESSMWLMMLVGFGAVGVSLRQRAGSGRMPGVARRG